jgi:hypothetical protein
MNTPSPEVCTMSRDRCERCPELSHHRLHHQHAGLFWVGVVSRLRVFPQISPTLRQRLSVPSMHTCHDGPTRTAQSHDGRLHGSVKFSSSTAESPPTNPRIAPATGVSGGSRAGNIATRRRGRVPTQSEGGRTRRASLGRDPYGLRSAHGRVLVLRYLAWIGDRLEAGRRPSDTGRSRSRTAGASCSR